MFRYLKFPDWANDADSIKKKRSKLSIIKKEITVYHFR